MGQSNQKMSDDVEMVAQNNAMKYVAEETLNSVEDRCWLFFCLGKLVLLNIFLALKSADVIYFTIEVMTRLTNLNIIPDGSYGNCEPCLDETEIETCLEKGNYILSGDFTQYEHESNPSGINKLIGGLIYLVYLFAVTFLYYLNIKTIIAIVKLSKRLSCLLAPLVCLFWLLGKIIFALCYIIGGFLEFGFLILFGYLYQRLDGYKQVNQCLKELEEKTLVHHGLFITNLNQTITIIFLIIVEMAVGQGLKLVVEKFVMSDTDDIDLDM